MAMKTLMTRSLTLSSRSTPLAEASTHEGSRTVKKFAKVIAHSALMATLITLLSTVANASAIWGN
jgi:hypothetical protein